MVTVCEDLNSYVKVKISAVPEMVFTLKWNKKHRLRTKFFENGKTFPFLPKMITQSQ